MQWKRWKREVGTWFFSRKKVSLFIQRLGFNFFPLISFLGFVQPLFEASCHTSYLFVCVGRWIANRFSVEYRDCATRNLVAPQVTSCVISVLYTETIHCQSTGTHTHTHTHRAVRRGKGLQIRFEQTLKMRKEEEIEASLCMKRESFFRKKNQVPTFLFHLFHCIDRDFVKTFLIHKHRPCEWENGIGNMRSHIQILILWWLSVGGSTVVTLGS